MKKDFFNSYFERYSFIGMSSDFCVIRDDFLKNNPFYLKKIYHQMGFRW